MLTERQTNILRAIIEEFIETAEPVGSKTLVEKYGLPYSSATIRNEMAVLEEEGLIEKTHTSSGRVPSSKGYRYYAENLLEDKLDENLALTIRDSFNVRTLNTEEVIRLSCDVLSKMTNLTSMVLGPEAQTQHLKHIKLFPVDEKSAIAVIITDTGHTENRMFQFDQAVSVKDIETTTEILNDRLSGTPICDVVEKMESIRPILAAAVEKHEILFRAFVESFIKFASDNIYFSGKENMLYQPEFADIEKLKSMMSMLENSSAFRQIEEGEGTLMLRKNDKSQLVWRDDIAIVSSKLRIKDNEEAQLMLVGPNRMDYERIVSMMDYVTSIVEKILKGGNND